MASVYLAWLDSDEGFQRPVAAKVMHPTLEHDPKRIPMVLSEARIASRVRHANVVSVVDVVTSEFGPVLISEYVAGDSLSHVLEQCKHKVPWPIVARIAVDTLEGLHAAHEATNEEGLPLQVVHRDVSPQNILLDEAGAARLVDFGVAKALERAYATESGEVRGKIAYMAPEQLDGKNIDRRADIWGFGMVLWQMLAGQKPFADLDAGPLMRRVLAADITPPDTVRECPAPLVEVCLKALAAAPDERYATARLMAIAVEKAITPASSRELAQWVKKNSGTVLATRRALLAEMANFAARLRAEGPYAGYDPLVQSAMPDAYGRRTPSYPTLNAVRPSSPPTAPAIETASLRTARGRVWPWAMLTALTLVIAAGGLGWEYRRGGPVVTRLFGARSSGEGRPASMTLPSAAPEPARTPDVPRPTAPPAATALPTAMPADIAPNAPNAPSASLRSSQHTGAHSAGRVAPGPKPTHLVAAPTSRGNAGGSGAGAATPPPASTGATDPLDRGQRN